MTRATRPSFEELARRMDSAWTKALAYEPPGPIGTILEDAAEDICGGFAAELLDAEKLCESEEDEFAAMTSPARERFCAACQVALATFRLEIEWATVDFIAGHSAARLRALAS
jgi:hypothetical protein